MSILFDQLSLFFTFLILITSVPITIYSIGYVGEYKNTYSCKYNYFMTILFILSMLGVILANNSIVFLVFWELMSAISFFLVIYEYKKSETISSGIMYFIMTHISGLLLMVMFTLLFKYTGSFEFSEIIKEVGSLTVSQKTLIFSLALFGFGAKAGLIPLHSWLPKAHPAAPSNVSALMSGVMLKVAIYGFLRVMFMFMGELSPTYGIIVMVIGTLTAIYSILNAIVQDDIKKLLAFSSAENIGIIFAIAGLTMVFAALKMDTLATIALTATLFHSLNHAVFKSLLFMSAGSVLYSTGTKNMNELGGLHKKMKFATYCAFIGTIAISSIPPLNGFASEVLIFRSFIKAMTALPSTEIIFLVIGCGILLALTSGGAMYAAIKSFGITYLGEPRTYKAINTHKLPLSMNVGLGITSLYAVLLGIFAPFCVKEIAKIATNTLSISSSTEVTIFNSELTIVITALVIIFMLTLLLTTLGTKKQNDVVDETWACGFNNITPVLQYTGSGFSQPVTKVFGPCVSYEKEVKIKSNVLLKQKTQDIIEKYIYKNVIKLVNLLSTYITKINYGKIQLSISYIFISLIVTLILVFKLI